METVTLNTVPTTDAEYEAAIDQMMMQMEQMLAPMAEQNRRIEKLQADNKEKIAHLERLLTRLEAS